MINCKQCKFLIKEPQPTFPVHYDYLCAAAIDEDKEHCRKYKRMTNGVDINFIRKEVLPAKPPDWCPILEGFISEEEARVEKIVVDGMNIVEVKDVKGAIAVEMEG